MKETPETRGPVEEDPSVPNRAAASEDGPPSPKSVRKKKRCRHPVPLPDKIEAAAKIQRRRDGRNQRRKEARCQHGKQAKAYRKRQAKALSDAERSRVIKFLNSAGDSEKPLHNYIWSVIERDSRRKFLTHEDKMDIVARARARFDKYLPKLLGARNPWSLMITMIRHEVYDYLKPLICKVEFTFRRGARIKHFVKTLKLNNAKVESSWTRADKKKVVVLWMKVVQLGRVKRDSRVERAEVIFNGQPDSIDPVTDAMPDPNSRAALIDQDIQEALKRAEYEIPISAKVFQLHFEGETWAKISEAVGKSIRQCQNLYRKFIRFFKERFPELKKY